MDRLWEMIAERVLQRIDFSKEPEEETLKEIAWVDIHAKTDIPWTADIPKKEE